MCEQLWWHTGRPSERTIWPCRGRWTMVGAQTPTARIPQQSGFCFWSFRRALMSCRLFLGTVRGETYVYLLKKYNKIKFMFARVQWQTNRKHIIISRLKRSQVLVIWFLCCVTSFSINKVEHKKDLNKQLVVLLQSCSSSSCGLTQVISHIISTESL